MSQFTQDAQEFFELQEAKAEIADELFTLCEAHQDKWGLTYVKTQTGQGVQNAQTHANGTKPQAHKPGRNGHKEVANGSAQVRRGMAGR